MLHLKWIFLHLRCLMSTYSCTVLDILLPSFSKNFPKTCLKNDKINQESLIKWHPVEVHFI